MYLLNEIDCLLKVVYNVDMRKKPYHEAWKAIPMLPYDKAWDASSHCDKASNSYAE